MSDSEDDVPLNQRKVEVKTEPAEAKQHETVVKSEPEINNNKPKVKEEEKIGDVGSDEAKPQKSKPAAKKEPPQPAAKGKVKAEVKQEAKETDEKKEKGAKLKKEEGTVAVKKEVKVKKEYDLPGQTKDTPEENDPLRKFYTSLLEQRPDSDMARRWCCQFGLLSVEEAEQFVKSKKGSVAPTKSPSKPRPASASVKREKPAASEKKPPAKKAAPAAKRPAPKRPRPSASSEEEDSSDDEKTKKGGKRKPLAALSDSDSDEDDKPLARRAVAAKTKVLPKNARDVAFTDGGLSGDSDDDVPLVKRSRV